MIVRHDVPEQRYLADPGRFAAVGAFSPDGDHACLINDRWLITAAHIAVDLITGAPITMNDGQVYHVDRIVLHPGFSDEPTRHDLALVRTNSIVSGIVPLTLYDSGDERGRTATFIGRGDFGTGLTGSIGTDGVLRVAVNRITDVTEQWLKFRFDPPGSQVVLDLEVISGDGDSCGPALVRTSSNQCCLAGISSWQADRGQEGRYGVVEHYARISRYLGWINSIVI